MKYFIIDRVLLKKKEFLNMIFAQELYYLLNIQWVEILGKTSIDLHFNVELWENLQLWILLLYNIIPFYPPISCPTVYGNENYTKFIECFFLSETLKNKFEFEKAILKPVSLWFPLFCFIITNTIDEKGDIQLIYRTALIHMNNVTEIDTLRIDYY